MPALGPPASSWREDTSPIGPWRRPRQGRLGDCWLVAPMLALHELDPGFATRTVHLSPGRGLARVTLHGRRGPVHVTLDRRMPVNATGAWTHARESGAGPGWVGLVEKAAAVHVSGSYRLLSRGFGGSGLALLTGQRSRLHLRLPQARVIRVWLESGHGVVASTHPLGPLVRTDHGPLPRSHVFAVVGADHATGRVQLRNPWDPDRVLSLDARTFRRGFVSVERTRRPVV